MTDAAHRMNGCFDVEPTEQIRSSLEIKAQSRPTLEGEANCKS